jgi:hypothetical protein
MNAIYTPQKKPYAHQLQALERLKGKQAFALLMKMRTGKTKVLLDDFGQLELDGAVERLLVIAPGGVYRTWVSAIQEHCSQDLLKRLGVWVWESGASKTKQVALQDFLSAAARPQILLMNVEALSSVKRAKAVAKQFLADGNARTMLAIDESTIIKRHDSKRTEFILNELKPLATYRRILTGLVTPRSPLDLYSQFDFLDNAILGHRSYLGFRSRFAIMRPIIGGGRAIQTVVGYRDSEELQARIAPHSFRVRLEDCYDLPPKIYQRRDVPLTDEQEKLYNDMLHFASAQLKSGTFVSATVVVAQIIRRHQILCGHTVDEKGTYHDIAERRIETLLEVLEEEGEDKAIIWCAYDPCIRKVSAALQKEYGEASVARFWGGNVNQREEEERRFLNDEKCRFMVATPAAGGRGRTWNNASLTIYHSCTPDLEHRSQSEERTQAVGKVRSGLYIDLIALGKVEEKYLKCLRGKIDISTVINGDNYQEWLI